MSKHIEGGGIWSPTRFTLGLMVPALAGLGVVAALEPPGSGLLAAAGAGAAFGCFASISGYVLIARSADESIQKGVQVFLAVMTVKMLAFAAFLLTIALTTSLNPAALGGGIVGTTLAGEVLAIMSLRRVQVPPTEGGEAAGAAGATGNDKA